MERIVVAMSGGVDSAVTASLLVEQGYEVIGVTMLVWSPPGVDMNYTDSCCGLSAAEDARRVASRLGIRHYTLDFRDRFYDDIVRNYVDEYRAGRTPNPCVRCNEFLKFGALLDRARELGAERIATGHYARVRYHDEVGRWQVLRAADTRKDQSYALYRLSQEQLSRTLFPLGGFTKGETRTLAADLGFAVASKPDSQETCFVPNNDYPQLLQLLAPDTATPGAIVDPEGRQLGEHTGVAFYTIGQRKRLGISAREPLYVSSLDPEKRTVTVAPGSHPALYQTRVEADQVNLVSLPAWQGSLNGSAKIRYNMADQPSSLELVEQQGRSLLVAEFEQPLRAVTPGQSLVAYQGEVLVGGGVIRSAQ